MAGRIRMIKPDVLEDEVASALSDAAWRLWVSAWVLADDHGNLRAGTKYLAAHVWQDTAHDSYTPLLELVRVRRFKPYSVNDQRYVTIHGWSAHQRVDNASKPKVPGPKEDDGTWFQQLSRDLAANLGESLQSAGTLGTSPLAHVTRREDLSLSERSEKRHTEHAESGVHAVGEKRTRGSKGTRIASDWKPKDETVQWAAQQGVDAVACTAEFVEYWLSVAGSKGCKADWDMAFRVRLRQLLTEGRAPRCEAPSQTDMVILHHGKRVRIINGQRVEEPESEIG